MAPASPTRSGRLGSRFTTGNCCLSRKLADSAERGPQYTPTDASRTARARHCACCLRRRGRRRRHCCSGRSPPRALGRQHAPRRSLGRMAAGSAAGLQGLADGLGLGVDRGLLAGPGRPGGRPQGRCGAGPPRRFRPGARAVKRKVATALRGSGYPCRPRYLARGQLAMVARVLLRVHICSLAQMSKNWFRLRY